MADRAVDVYVQIVGQDFLAGSLWFHRGRGAESATFAYEPAYLASRGRTRSTRRCPWSGPAPDAAAARDLQRLLGLRSRQLGQDVGRQRQADSTAPSEADYLLEVRDDLRQGSLRFARPGHREFHRRRGSDRVPRAHRPPEAAGDLGPGRARWRHSGRARGATRSGGSLGGARPKAHVVGPNGRIAIAKFPRADDDECERRGLGGGRPRARPAGRPGYGRQHSPYRRRQVGADRRPLRSRRRGTSRLRQRDDPPRGAGRRAEVLPRPGEAIEEQSDRVTSDLQELWRRIAFSILVSNTDDHLRNHGFLRLSSGGWSLSPAFDINPNPARGRKQLATSIDGRSPEASLETLFGVADLFGIDDAELRTTIGRASAATSEMAGGCRGAGARSG